MLSLKEIKNAKQVVFLHLTGRIKGQHGDEFIWAVDNQLRWR